MFCCFLVFKFLVEIVFRILNNCHFSFAFHHFFFGALPDTAVLFRTSAIVTEEHLNLLSALPLKGQC